MSPDRRGLSVTSPELAHAAYLDARHTSDGEDQPPALHVAGVPRGCVELAVVCHDPDAPRPWGFTHWLLYGIPPDTRVIDATADDRFRPAVNDFGVLGYGGPKPPRGHGRHHYYFWVFALDRQVTGTPPLREFLDAYEQSILDQNRIVGVYER